MDKLSSEILQGICDYLDLESIAILSKSGISISLPLLQSCIEYRLSISRHLNKTFQDTDKIVQLLQEGHLILLGSVCDAVKDIYCNRDNELEFAVGADSIELLRILNTFNACGIKWVYPIKYNMLRVLNKCSILIEYFNIAGLRNSLGNYILNNKIEDSKHLISFDECTSSILKSASIQEFDGLRLLIECIGDSWILSRKVYPIPEDEHSSIYTFRHSTMYGYTNNKSNFIKLHVGSEHNIVHPSAILLDDSYRFNRTYINGTSLIILDNYTVYCRKDRYNNNQNEKGVYRSIGDDKCSIYQLGTNASIISLDEQNISWYEYPNTNLIMQIAGPYRKILSPHMIDGDHYINGSGHHVSDAKHELRRLGLR